MTETKTLTYAEQLQANLKVLKDGLGMSHDAAYSRALNCDGPVKLTGAETHEVAVRLLMKEGKSYDEANTIVMNDEDELARKLLARAR